MVDQEQVEQMQKQLEQAKSVIQSQEEEMRKLRKGADDTMEALVELQEEMRQLKAGLPRIASGTTPGSARNLLVTPRSRAQPSKETVTMVTEALPELKEHATYAEFGEWEFKLMLVATMYPGLAEFIEQIEVPTAEATVTTGLATPMPPRTKKVMPTPGTKTWTVKEEHKKLASPEDVERLYVLLVVKKIKSKTILSGQKRVKSTCPYVNFVSLWTRLQLKYQPKSQPARKAKKEEHEAIKMAQDETWEQFHERYFLSLTELEDVYLASGKKIVIEEEDIIDQIQDALTPSYKVRFQATKAALDSRLGGYTLTDMIEAYDKVESKLKVEEKKGLTGSGAARANLSKTSSKQEDKGDKKEANGRLSEKEIEGWCCGCVGSFLREGSAGLITNASFSTSRVQYGSRYQYF